MPNQKPCPICRVVVNLDTEARYIGRGDGIGKVGLDYYNHKCGTTLTQYAFPEPQSIKEAIGYIDIICGSLNACFVSYRRSYK